MKNSKTNRDVNPVLRVFTMITLLLLISLTAFPDNNETTVRFKPEYKIKRIPNVGVTIYSVSEQEQKEEYIFKDFNADVVLLIYRRINTDQIAVNLAKKYYLSKDDSRRGVKRVVNVLEEWGMVTE